MEAVRVLCRAILATHAIEPRNVIGHGDIAPEREESPGDGFDWTWLAAAGIGMWPTEDAIPVAANGSEIGAVLAEIGYDSTADRTAVLRAFQRHWLPGSVTGLADAATRVRLEQVRVAMTEQPSPRLLKRLRSTHSDPPLVDRG